MSRRLELTVPPELEGVRVDTLLRKHLNLSGTVVKRIKWLPDGILVDGLRVNTRFCPKAGQVLSARLSDPARNSGIVPTAGPLDIVYEDEDLIVLNKAPGVSVHPGPGHFDDTLGNFLTYYYETSNQEADFHPVHRLDRGTSGLLVTAKHPHAQEVLKNQLHTGDFSRVYLAVCEGTPDPPSGVQPWGGRSLVELRLETGRTHQIRVHMAHIGHPLTGDFLYGKENPFLIPRPALHSARLTLLHPISLARLDFSLPLPRDMARLRL